jgi:hypothetical protein
MKAVIQLPDGTTITLSSRRSPTQGRRKGKQLRTKRTQRPDVQGHFVQLPLPW